MTTQTPANFAGIWEPHEIGIELDKTVDVGTTDSLHAPAMIVRFSLPERASPPTIEAP